MGVTGIRWHSREARWSPGCPVTHLSLADWLHGVLMAQSELPAASTVQSMAAAGRGPAQVRAALEAALAVKLKPNSWGWSLQPLPPSASLCQPLPVSASLYSSRPVFVSLCYLCQLPSASAASAAYASLHQPPALGVMPSSGLGSDSVTSETGIKVTP